MISSALWKRRRRKKRDDANKMILEAGATGCKPLDRRTRYVDIGAILGNEGPIGVLTDHFNNIYTATPAERREDRDKQECLLNHVTDPMNTDEVRTKPPQSTFEFHLNKEHLSDDIPEAFDKWVIYTDGACRGYCVAVNVSAG